MCYIFTIARSSKGRTAAFEAVNLGSIPSLAAKINIIYLMCYIVIMSTKNKKQSISYLFLNVILLIFILFFIIYYVINFYNTKIEDDKNISDNKNNLIYFDNKIDLELENKKEDFINNQNTSVEEKETNVIRKNGTYVKVINSCDFNYSNGSCVRARICPSLSCESILLLRNNIVLKSDDELIENDNIKWQHVFFDEWVRYNDRLANDFYISNDFLEHINSYKESVNKNIKKGVEINKKIIVSLGEQKLYAYEDNQLFMEISISTGLDDLPTPRGTFGVFEKTPSRYMQGPLPNISDQYYDLPGVPWTMYFTKEGAAIHGAYWHSEFGSQWSHGCVNLRPEDAELLYNWTNIGTTVIVKN